MAQNITLMGASYSAVPAVTLPKTGGGTARFDDATITTATASDVASGKLFLAADGTITTGTSSGGGGSSWEFLGSKTLNVSTTSTSESQVGNIYIPSLASDIYTSTAVLWVRVRDLNGKRAGYFYGSDTIFVNSNAANGSTSSFDGCANSVISVTSGGGYSTTYGRYGVYAKQVASNGQINIFRRYNNNYSKTINGSFEIKAYRLALPAGETLFD